MKHGVRIWMGTACLWLALVPAAAGAFAQRAPADSSTEQRRGPFSRMFRRETPVPPARPTTEVRQQAPTQPEASGSPRLSTPSPNPANAEVRIDYTFGPNQSALLQIYDFLGKPVRSLALRKGSSSIVLDVANLPPGIYFYSLEVDGKLVATKRLSISR